MPKITSSIDLRAAIVALEIKQKQEETSLKEGFYLAYQEIQPVQIIKSSVKKLIDSNDLKDDLINASIGMAVGYVSESLFEGETHSPARKLLGTALVFGVTNLITKKPEFLKVVKEGFMHLFRNSAVEEVTDASIDEKKEVPEEQRL
jgi:hypothetical protein